MAAKSNSDSEYDSADSEGSNRTLEPEDPSKEAAHGHSEPYRIHYTCPNRRIRVSFDPSVKDPPGQGPERFQEVLKALNISKTSSPSPTSVRARDESTTVRVESRSGARSSADGTVLLPGAAESSAIADNLPARRREPPTATQTSIDSGFLSSPSRKEATYCSSEQDTADSDSASEASLSSASDHKWGTGPPVREDSMFRPPQAARHGSKEGARKRWWPNRTLYESPNLENVYVSFDPTVKDPPGLGPERFEEVVEALSLNRGPATSPATAESSGGGSTPDVLRSTSTTDDPSSGTGSTSPAT